MESQVLNNLQSEFQKIVNHLGDEYSHLQIGRASGALVEGLSIEAYGSSQPLKNVASISIPDAKSVQIQPWDKSLLSAIEKAIQSSDLNISPVNNGLSIILNIPPLTEERRRDLVKVVHRLAEEAKIAVRNARQKAFDQIKAAEKNGDLTEDQKHGAEKKVQEKVDEVNKSIEDHSKKKEHDIMTV
ncbi:ribosome recycling factor [Candidatus Peregrinibacteria bacterium]|nr:ribosome recycling factor [Candidatus Peregrinibacteria bacterium]